MLSAGMLPWLNPWRDNTPTPSMAGTPIGTPISSARGGPVGRQRTPTPDEVPAAAKADVAAKAGNLGGTTLLRRARRMSVTMQQEVAAP